VSPSTHRQRFATAARGPEPDLGLLCLLLGAEADPSLDDAGIATALRVLDRLAGEVSRLLADEAPADRTPQSWAAALRAVLGTRHGFHGRAADYGRLDSSLLHAVLRRRRGLPILLSVVWLEVGRRAGAPVYGMALPGHFMVGVGTPDGHHVLADPFTGGTEVSSAEAAARTAQATGRVPRDGLGAVEHHAARTLDVVARVLNNIRVWAAERPEQSAVALWAVELALLLPRHPARLRLDHAKLLVERGEFARGATELEEYAEVVAAVDREAAAALRRQARAARALLN
jgi:regulator of sirC expression with transglutaminase-like and TPR domain